MSREREKVTTGVGRLHLEDSWFQGLLLTQKGSLIGGVKLEGRDPDGLNKDDFEGLTTIASRFFSELESNIIVTQYFGHYDGAEIFIKERKHPTSNLLSKRREEFLNKQNLTSTTLVFLFEIMPEVTQVDIGALNFLVNAFKSVYSKDARRIVSNSLSKSSNVIMALSALRVQADSLNEVMTDFTQDWESLVNPKIMNKSSLYSFLKYTSNLNPYYLSSAYDVLKAPDERLDRMLPDGDRSLINIDGVELMKLSGDKPVYIRILSVNSFNSKAVSHGLWSLDQNSPSRQKGNYLIMARYQPLSQIQKSTLFMRKESDLNRRNMNIMDAVSGKNQGVSELDRRALMKPAIRQALEDLGEAENLDVNWGNFHSSIVVFNTNVKDLLKDCIKIKRSCDRAGLSTCWESVGLTRAYKTIMPAGRSYSTRDINFNSSQVSAASLLYAPSEGQRIVEDLPGEECQYIFTSVDGTPFYFSPFVGEKCVIIGVGPIRSGKSFFKNTLATHFLKYGGCIHGIDVDQGLEPVSHVFGEDGGIFRSEDDTKGFNPFVSCRSEHDLDFVNHLTQLVLAMIKLNDTEEMQVITSDEQQSLDRAIQSTMRLEKDLQTFANVWRHSSKSLKAKLERWVTKPDGTVGVYAKYFDAKVDSIGSIDKKVMAYNLKSIKDDKKILPLVMAELFFRTIRVFEDTKTINIPNFLDVDEFHAFSSFDYVIDKLIRSVRTWGKYKGGVGLWTQNVKDYKDLKQWSALRSAASTYFFMADSTMNEDEYMEAFLLTPGECDAIKSLKPKKEAYIIQRQINISKKVVLAVEPEQHIISTSNANETFVRTKNLEACSTVEEAIIKTAEELGLYKDKKVINYE